MAGNPRSPAPTAQHRHLPRRSASTTKWRIRARRSHAAHRLDTEKRAEARAAELKAEITRLRNEMKANNKRTIVERVERNHADFRFRQAIDTLIIND